MADIQTIGDCENCAGASLTCKYNYFCEGELQIHSWEHKCPDCGQRRTTAYRSDDEDIIFADIVTDTCPYCQRRGDPS